MHACNSSINFIGNIFRTGDPLSLGCILVIRFFFLNLVLELWNVLSRAFGLHTGYGENMDSHWLLATQLSDKRVPANCFNFDAHCLTQGGFFLCRSLLWHLQGPNLWEIFTFPVEKLMTSYIFIRKIWIALFFRCPVNSLQSGFVTNSRRQFDTQNHSYDEYTHKPVRRGQ